MSKYLVSHGQGACDHASPLLIVEASTPEEAWKKAGEPIKKWLQKIEMVAVGLVFEDEPYFPDYGRNSRLTYRVRLPRRRGGEDIRYFSVEVPLLERV